jgi:hypothetical protein
MAMRASRKGLPKKPESDEDEVNIKEAIIEDNYEFGNMEVKKAEPAKILDDDFMGALRVAAVPDSDDECYF